MQERKDKNINGKALGITILLSLLAGFLTSLWAVNLDPKGTGGSILMLPIIITLFPISISLFVTGLISLKSSFGKYLVGASLLIPISFFVIKELLRFTIN
jgi:hypothetical protein